MNIVSIRPRSPMTQEALASRRACRDGVRDIGNDEIVRRAYAEEKLNDALRVFRTVFDSQTLVTILQTKTTSERRIAGRTQRRGMTTTTATENSASGLRNCECLLRHAGDLLSGITALLESARDLVVDAEDAASKAYQPELALQVQTLADKLEGTLAYVRERLADSEARARR